MRATWTAYRGREDSGIWWIQPNDAETLEARARFSFYAANAAAKLSIAPTPLPTPTEYSPLWEKELAIEREHNPELDDLVPYGLGIPDADAVDIHARSWLELLRKNEIGFRMGRGETAVGGERHETVHGTIDDLLGSSLTYCLRRARDEGESDVAKILSLRPEGGRELRLENQFPRQAAEAGGLSPSKMDKPETGSEVETLEASGQITSAQPGLLQQRKRGRKSKFSAEQLAKAQQLKANGKPNQEVAKVLFGPDPTPAHRRSVSTILKWHAARCEREEKGREES